MPDEVPDDPLLDWYAALRAVVRGRMQDARGEMASVNAALRDLFSQCLVDTIDEGVLILPELADFTVPFPQTAARLARDAEIYAPPLIGLASSESGNS